MSTKLTYTSGGLDPQIDADFERHLEEARSHEGEALPQVIAGERLAEGPIRERLDPTDTSRVATRYHEADAAMVERAVAAAKAATKDWRRMPYGERCDLLQKAAREIEGQITQFAAVLSLETGKTRVEALAEVQEGIDLIDAYVGDVRDNKGYTKDLSSFTPGEHSIDVLAPYGVFGVVCPFNFPFALAIGMTVAALAAGNTVVMKPSEDAPLSGGQLVEVFEAAGLPTGVLNFVHGGAETGKALVQSTVDGIAFTGSAAVGATIANEMRSGSFSRPALMEMGGKNPTIVADSADLEAAAEGVARAAFGLSGQKCSACSRAIVVGDQDRVDRFTELLGEQARNWSVGDPADREAQLGPVINQASVERFEKAAAEAKQDGDVVAGGARPDLPGYYVEPTVVANLPIGHRLTRDELFLPFVAVTRVESLDQAIDEANDIDYGLTAGIFSDKEDDVNEFLDRIEAGVTYVNRRAGSTTGAWPGAQTFCGWKASGSTGKGGLGSYYVPQFMREQSRTYAS
jgi:1-pyrroline-5-carboxylate dehydrogenase